MYLDVFEAPGPEEAAQRLAMFRTFGRAATETWQAVKTWSHIP